MSFSSDTKRELCQPRPDKKCCAQAECYGILLYCNTFSAREIRIITASPDFAQRLPRLFRRAFGLEFDRLPSAPGGRQSFVINDPEKRYHLELATPHRSVSREAFSLLLDMGFSPKETQRSGNSLLYFKQADFIADFLTTIGASGAAMAIMTAKVEKEMRNTITRQINCDNANADKTVAASQAQLAAIRRIVREYGLESLPEPLRDAALLRIANPEASLADLVLLSDPPVTKSCLSHRLKKIMNFEPEE